MDAVVYYRICNATVSVANVENAHHSTRLLAQTTLRNMLGIKNLAEILSDRDAIAMSMQVETLSKFWLYFCSSSSQMSCCLIWRWLFVGYHFEQYLFLIRIKWKSSEITTTIILKNGIFFLTFIWKIFFFA